MIIGLSNILTHGMKLVSNQHSLSSKFLTIYVVWEILIKLFYKIIYRVTEKDRKSIYLKISSHQVIILTQL